MSGGTPAFHREIRRGEPWSGRAQNESTRGKAREKSNRHPNGEILLDNADAVIDALLALWEFSYLFTLTSPNRRSARGIAGHSEIRLEKIFLSLLISGNT